MRIKGIEFFLNSFVLLISTQTLHRSIFFWITSGFLFIPTMTSLKGEVKYSCAAGWFEKRVKANFSNVTYTLFLPELKHFSSGIFLKPMLIYDQGIVKIQKMEKLEIFLLLLQPCLWIFKAWVIARTVLAPSHPKPRFNSKISWMWKSLVI